jgi:hypothetical protein
MPTARQLLGAALAPNGKIYVIGGTSGSAFLGRLEEYTPATDSWRGGTADLPTMPVPRQGLGAAVGSDGRLYAAGGYNNTDRNDLHAWTVGATSWTTLAPMHIGRQETTLVATPQGTLYAFGGYNGIGCPAPTCNPANPAGPQPSVEMYSIATNTWTMRAPMPTARYGMSAVRALNGKIYVIGGQSPTFSAVGVAAGTRTVRVRAVDPLGAYAIASTTITVTPAPVMCAPRPHVQVATTKLGSGQLRAILGAQTNVGTTTNGLSSVRITKIANAAVTVNGAAAAEGQTVTLPANSQQATLLVTRATGGQATTVSFAVTDACGEWKSFVGGGPSAF